MEQPQDMREWSIADCLFVLFKATIAALILAAIYLLPAILILLVVQRMIGA